MLRLAVFAVLILATGCAGQIPDNSAEAEQRLRANNPVKNR